MTKNPVKIKSSDQKGINTPWKAYKITTKAAPGWAIYAASSGGKARTHAFRAMARVYGNQVSYAWITSCRRIRPLDDQARRLQAELVDAYCLDPCLAWEHDGDRWERYS